MKDFKNKVAAVTGAASGIGRALALELASRGCHLALADIDEAGLRQTATMIGGKVKVHLHQVDVSDRESVQAWADLVANEFGKVNIVFNNAGVALAATLDKVKPTDFEWIMGINFWGVVWGTQAFLPHLKRAGEGHVVNVSSLFGLIAQPTQGTYNASKFAVRGYTEALRQELDMEANGVSATCVHPGGIRTNIAKAARMDIASVGGTQARAETARERFDKMLNLTSAQWAARKILRGVRNNRRRVLIGPDAVLGDWIVRLLGAWYQPLITFIARRMLG